MAHLTGDQLKAAFKRDGAGTARILQKSLQEFGYPISLEYTIKEMDRLVAGGDPKGGPSMFLSGWLKDGTD